MKTLKLLIKNILSRFIIFKYFIFSASDHKLKKIKIDFKSIFIFDKKSNLNINHLNLINSILIIKNSKLNINQLTVRNCHLIIENSNITIHRNSNISDYFVHFENTTFIGGEHLSITKSYAHNAIITSQNGVINLGWNVNIHALIKIRDGSFSTGNNVFINHDTEIRSEKSISIGNNVLISTDCIIYDTNTHSTNYLYRLQEMKDGFPNSTSQNSFIRSQISTKEIIIGDDVWIGKKVAILKGTVIENQSIVALGAVITGKVPSESIAIGNPYIIKENKNSKTIK
jgi:acetyltransferase-like isoleucine patch superfamily enzyme